MGTADMEKIGNKCKNCTRRFPACQDHCEYGEAAKKQRADEKRKRANKAAIEVRLYYQGKKYRR